METGDRDRLNLPGPVRPVLGRDYAYFRAEFTTEGGTTVEYGEYLCFCVNGEWRFAYPHLEEELKRKTEHRRRKGGEIILRQYSPPLPNDVEVPEITLDMEDIL